jgi:hypothetical protein
MLSVLTNKKILLTEREQLYLILSGREVAFSFSASVFRQKTATKQQFTHQFDFDPADNILDDQMEHPKKIQQARTVTLGVKKK